MRIFNSANASGWSGNGFLEDVLYFFTAHRGVKRERTERIYSGGGVISNLVYGGFEYNSYLLMSRRSRDLANAETESAKNF